MQRVTGIGGIAAGCCGALLREQATVISAVAIMESAVTRWRVEEKGDKGI